MIKELENIVNPYVYINLFNLNLKTIDSDIREFYKAFKLTKLDLRLIQKGLADIQLDTKEEARDLIKFGGGV